MDIAMTHGVRTNANHFGTSLKKIFVLLAALLLAVLALTFAAPAGSASAAEIGQCNGIAEGGGQGVNCDVTVVNNLDITTGVASSTVTTKVCNGPANTVIAGCDPVTTSYDSLVTSVNQCNASANGPGSSVTCNVSVTNNITGGSSTGVTAATVNQCNNTAGGGGEFLNCSPRPANTTNATITQCNYSTNGGGATVECSVSPSFASAELPVSINQCNDSTNEGGGTTRCTASLSNNVLTATAPTTPTAKNVLNDARTDGFTHPGWNNGSSDFLGVGVLLVAGLLTAAFVTRRMRAHR